MKKRKKRLLSILLAAVMSVSVFSAANITASADTTQEENAIIMQAYNGEGVLNTFIGEKLSDEKITTPLDAYNFVLSMKDRIGGDETTELELYSIRQNEDGMTVITFSQQAGSLLVYGAAVKLILDKDDYPIGIVSSIMPNVQIRPIDEWAVDAEQAEQTVMALVKAYEAKDELVEGTTERVIIPLPNTGRYVCSWVVYTYEPNADQDGYVYTAHYVSADGNYLYSIPVSQPGDPDAGTGQSAKAIFDFDAYEKDEMTVSVNWHDGTVKDITVPVLKDSKTGKIYLADAERKILCGDQATYFYHNQIAPLEIQDGVDPIDASTYYGYIRVYDYYKQVGWEGPDGQGTPSLLLMNYVDMNGEPEFNACYVNKNNGFQIFAWTRVEDFGQCTDVIGHEYTHCVTTNTMMYNLYKNDPGAINEGYSDIMGSLIEIRLDGEGEGSWTLAENAGTFRSISDPHEYAQPEFAFDTYYAPKPPVPTGMNDQGGVHTNASMLCSLAYKLHKAGMEPIDQSYFWLNSALVISPQTDYPMMAKILPWVMKQLGYDEYLDTLEQAIEEAKFTVTEDPGTLPDGCGALTFDFTDIRDLAGDGRVRVAFYEAPEADSRKRVDAWPVAGTTVAKANLPAGDYYVIAGVADATGNITKKYSVFSEDGWTPIKDTDDTEGIKANGTPITLKAGEVKAISNKDFGSAALEMMKEIDPDYILPPAVPTAPTNVKVDKNGTVTWTASEKADYYKVAKIENGILYYGGEVSDTSYTLKRVPSADYKVCVIAYNENGISTKSVPVTVKVSKPLGYVNNVIVDENGNVSWDAADNAVAYRVVKVVNGKFFYGTKTEDTNYKLVSVPKKDYHVFVIAYDADGKTAWGKRNLVEVGDLGVAFNTKVDQYGNVSWSAARNAAYYRVGKIVNGKLYVGPKTENTSYRLASVPAEDYQVFVVAFDNDGCKISGSKVNVKIG